MLLGATGLNAFERLLIGSSSEYIMRHATIDLLIVRDGEKHKPKDLIYESSLFICLSALPGSFPPAQTVLPNHQVLKFYG